MPPAVDPSGIPLLYDLRWWLTRTRAGIAVAAVVTVAVVTGAGAFAWWQLAGPQRFEPLQLDVTAAAAPPRPQPVPSGPTTVAPAAAPDEGPSARPATAGPQVWLLFSTGTGALTAEEAAWMRMPDGTSRAGDRLTDSIMLAVVDPATHRTALLSIPRDTWRFDRGYRINAVYARDGIQAFVDDVRDLTGLPVHHVVGVNMRGFARAVDAAGGVVVATDRPLRDTAAHLRELPSGCWRLDGPAALAYVRSRHTQTFSGGRWRPDRTASDFGRAERQREVLGSLWEQLRGPRLVTMAPTALQIVGDDLTLDRSTTPSDLVGFARAASAIAGGSVESYTLPTTGRTIRRAAAQVVDDDRAALILERLQTWPSPPAASPAPVPDTSPDAAASTPSPDPAPAGDADGPPPALDPATCDASSPAWAAS